MSGCSCWFVLPAESSRELIAKPVMFLQGPAVIFLIPLPLESREKAKLLLRGGAGNMNFGTKQEPAGSE